MATIKSDYILPNYDPEEVGMKGEKGDDGKTSYVHIAYSNSADGGVDFSTTDATNRAFTGYYTDFEMIDSTDPSKYEWQRTKGDSGKDGVAGKDGVGLKSTSISYASHTNASTPPSTGWQPQVPTVPAGQYLWTKTVWTYTDNSSETGYSVARMGQDGAKGNDGIAGKDGVGIKTTLIEYAVSTSGTTRPASAWSTTIPTVPAGQYLWTRTTWTYTDNTTEQGYTVARQGANGANGSNGVGISTTIIEYNKSTNSTTPPSTGWTSTIPSISGGQYLWTRVTLNYTDGKKTESYTVARQGEDGADGQLFTGETEPTDFNEGDIWYKVVSGKVTGVYEAKGGTWVEIPFESSVIAETIIGKTIQASRLTGSTIEGGEINGSVINGGEFNNAFTEQVGTDATLTGNTTIQRGIVETQYTINNTNTGTFLSSGRQTWNGVNIESVQNGADGLVAASSTFGATGIDIFNKEYHSQFGMVHLGYQDLMTLPKKEITEFSPDFEPYSVGQEPSAERYMRTVQLYGAFKNKNKVPANVGHEPLYMGTLPVGYRPSGTVRFVVPGSGVTRYVLQINNNGRMYMYNMGGWNGSSYTIVDVNPGSWLNVQCNFIAGNI
ncbi:virion structural protein [Enterococcus phage vB_Efm8_KEN21]